VHTVLLGDVQALRRHADASFELRRGSRDESGMLRSLLNLALAAMFEGGSVSAEALLEEMEALARGVGDAWFLSVALADLAASAFDRRDYARARSLDEEALALAEEVGDLQLRVGISATLAASEVELGEGDRAEARYQDTIAGCRDLDFPEQLIWSLNGLGILHAQRGEWQRALRLLGAAEGVVAEIEYANAFELGRHDRAVALVAKHVGEAAVAAGLAGGSLMGREAAIAYALAGPVPA
jgi:tetratricopeptide (TPR) repeat protein